MEHKHEKRRATAVDVKRLVNLAERMGIPTDTAIRQVEQLVAEPERTTASDHRTAPDAVATV